MAIGGARREKAKRSAIGVYFRQDSPFNLKVYDPDETPGSYPTGHRIQLHAAVIGVQHAATLKAKDEGMKQVTNIVIKTDNPYVFRGTTEWSGSWLNNGLRNPKGAAIANADLVHRLRREVDRLNTTQNCKVYFWHVAKKYNTEAYILANEAIQDRVAEENYMSSYVNFDA